MGAVYNEATLKKIMNEHDITVTVELNEGDANATVWTCDLTYDYVKINGEYHTWCTGVFNRKLLHQLYQLYQRYISRA